MGGVFFAKVLRYLGKCVTLALASKQASDNQEGPIMTDNHYPGYYSDLGEELAEMYPEDEEDAYTDYEDWED